MHESFDRALEALEQRTPKVKAEPLMPLADFLKRMGRPTPHAFANPPAAPTPPAGVCPGPACTFGDPEAQVTEVEMVDAQHPDTSEVQKRRRRRDADAKTREVRERLHVTVRVHRESDDKEVPPAPHQVCSPARPQASPAAPAATHTVQGARPAVEHMSRGPTPSPGSEIQATPPRGLLGIRVVPSAAEREGPSAAVLAAPEEKGQTEPATAVQAMVVLTDVSAFEEMLPEIVRARRGTCGSQSGTIYSGRAIDVGDGPDWAEGQGCLMSEGQGEAAAQDMPIARGWVDSPVGTTAQEGRGGAAGRDSIPLVEPRSSAFARAPSSVGESLTQDEITPDLGATCVERRVAAEKFASAEVDEGRVWPHWLQDVDVLPRPPGYRRPPPPCVRKEGHVLIPLEDIPEQDWSFAGPEEELAYWLSVLERIRQGDLPEDDTTTLYHHRPGQTG